MRATTCPPLDEIALVREQLGDPPGIFGVDVDGIRGVRGHGPVGRGTVREPDVDQKIAAVTRRKRIDHDELHARSSGTAEVRSHVDRGHVAGVLVDESRDGAEIVERRDQGRLEHLIEDPGRAGIRRSEPLASHRQHRARTLHRA